MQLNSRLFLRIISLVSLVGLTDTIYLTVNHYLGSGTKCLLLEGCEVVLSSQYSEIWGVPLAAFGIIFYLTIFTFSSLINVYERDRDIKILLILSSLGFLASMYFLYLQIFVIGAFCFYCLISLASSTTIFVSAVVIYKKIIKLA